MNTWLFVQALSSPFSILVTFGAVSGLGLAVWLVPEKRGFTLRAGAGVLAAALAGARLEYVALNWGYFFTHWTEIPQLWLGGLGWMGAMLGALLGLGMASLITPQNLGKLLDDYLPLLGAVAVCAGVFSFYSGTGYGPRADAWWGLPVQDEFGVTQGRWPIGLIGGGLVFAGAIFLSLAIKDRSWFSAPGRRGSLGWSWAAMMALAVSALRVDRGIFYRGVRWQTWAAMALSLLGLVSLVWYARYENDEHVDH